MPVICMINKQNSLMKEPYVSFDKKYKMIMEKLHGSKIELPVGNGKQGQFSNGFYNCDYAYQRNMMMKFNFVKVNPEQVEPKAPKDCTFVQCTYSFEYNESDMFDYHLYSWWRGGKGCSLSAYSGGCNCELYNIRYSWRI